MTVSTESNFVLVLFLADTKDSCLESEEQPNQESGPDSSSQLCGHIPAAECQGNACGSKLLKNVSQESTSCVTKLVKVTCGRFGDTDSEYIKARIFCLQHAIEIADLFRCKGGARILIICHSGEHHLAISYIIWNSFLPLPFEKFLSYLLN